jgi:AhpC/TSA family
MNSSTTIYALVAGEVLLGLVLALNLVLTLALIRRGRSTVGAQAPNLTVGLAPGEPAPDFHAETLHGQVVALSDFDAQPTAFLFVAPACTPCRVSMPEYRRLIPLARVHGVNLVIVSDGDVGGTVDMIGGGVAEGGLTVLLAPRLTNDMFDQFKVPATPHWVLIEKGHAVVSGVPNINYQAWKERVADWESTSPTRPASVSLMT